MKFYELDKTYWFNDRPHYYAFNAILIDQQGIAWLGQTGINPVTGETLTCEIFDNDGYFVQASSVMANWKDKVIAEGNYQ